MYPDNYLFYFETSLYKTNINNYKGAMKDIDKAISISPKPDATLYAQKAWIYYEQKDYENALNYVRIALDIDVYDDYALGLMAHMAYDHEDYDTIIKIAEKSFRYGKTLKYNPSFLVLYAKALYQKGNTNAALEQIDNALKLSPNNKQYILYKQKMLTGKGISD